MSQSRQALYQTEDQQIHNANELTSPTTHLNSLAQKEQSEETNSRSCLPVSANFDYLFDFLQIGSTISLLYTLEHINLLLKHNLSHTYTATSFFSPPLTPPSVFSG